MHPRDVLVATVGMSPPVVTSLWNYLARVGVPCRSIVLVGTAEPGVRDACIFLETALSAEDPPLHIETYVWREDDVRTTEQMIAFTGDLLDLLLRICQRGSGAPPRLHLNMAGGRKSMAVAVYLCAQLLGGGSVYHLVRGGVDVWNIELERVRSTIAEIAAEPDAPARREAYLRHRSELRPVLFPPPETTDVIEVPLIPFPASYVQDLVAILKSEIGVGLDELSLPLRDLERLEAAGLVRIDRRYRQATRVYPTVQGSRYARLFSSAREFQGSA